MSRFWLSYLRVPWLVLGVLGAITSVLGLRAATVPIDSSVEALVVEGDPDRVFFDDFQAHFGSGEFLVATIEGYRIFTYDQLTALKDLTQALADIPGVSDVGSLTTVEDIQGTDEDFVVGRFLDDIPTGEDELRALRMQAVANPLYRGTLISADAKTAAVIAELERELSGPEHSRVVDAVHDRLARLRSATTHLAGKPVLDHFAARFMRQDLQRFIPLTIALMAVILWLLLRNVFGTLLPLLTMSICLAWAMGFLGMIGGTVNNITTILPPLMMSLAVAVSIHMMTTYQDNLASAGYSPPPEGKDRLATSDVGGDTGRLVSDWVGRLRGRRAVAVGEATGATQDVSLWARRLHGEGFSLEHNVEVVRRTLVQLWQPCLVAALTTAAGFISLVVSDVPPMRDFGLSAAVGVMFSLVIVFCFVPVVWILVRRPVARHHDPLERDFMDAFLLRLTVAVEHQPRRVLLLTALLAVLAVVGVTRLRIETNLLEYFEPSSELVRDTNYVEHHLAGVEDVRISLRSNQPDLILSVANLQRIEALEHYLMSRSEVDETTSVVEYLKEMHQSFHNEDPAFYRLPEADDLIAQYMLLYDGQDLKNFLDDDRQWTAVYVRVHEHSSARLRELINDVHRYLGQVFPAEVEARVTGPTVLVTNLVDTLLDSQIESLALASLVIFAMVAILFRSVKIGLLAMLPNLLPVLLNLGLMGWIGIPLDTATAMISAVAIGIAVDDTIHLLAGYKHALGEGATTTQALRRVIATKGRAVVFTSIILASAFGVLMVSNFVPTVNFGALAALTMISALVADLLFLPALLLVSGLRL